MIPTWLHILSIVSLAIGVTGAVVIALDEAKYPQHMWIMNVVWPMTALFASVLGLLGYMAVGRNKTPGGAGGEPSFAVAVGTGTTHCGAGCTLGDIVA